jgi:hypothetical protein
MSWLPRRDREVFTGWIAGLGTNRGHRIVIGHWPTSPYGVVTDAMVEDRPDATGSHGFLRQAGTFTPIDFPSPPAPPPSVSATPGRSPAL